MQRPRIGRCRLLSAETVDQQHSEPMKGGHRIDPWRPLVVTLITTSAEPFTQEDLIAVNMICVNASLSGVVCLCCPNVQVYTCMYVSGSTVLMLVIGHVCKLCVHICTRCTSAKTCICVFVCVSVDVIAVCWCLSGAWLSFLLHIEIVKLHNLIVCLKFALGCRPVSE